MFPQKHIVYIYFLCFLLLSIKFFSSHLFPLLSIATFLTFINYWSRFRAAELIPGTAAALTLFLFVSFLEHAPAENAPKVVWVYEYSPNYKVAVLEGWKFVRVKDQPVEVGDYAYDNG